jgi:hypothetical protein
MPPVKCPCGQHDIPAAIDGIQWYWQRHARTGCTLELPDLVCWCGLKRSEHIKGHADKTGPAVPSEVAPSREQKLDDALRKILSLFSDEPKMYLRPCDPSHRMTYGDSDRVDEAFIAAEKALEAK